MNTQYTYLNISPLYTLTKSHTYNLWSIDTSFGVLYPCQTCKVGSKYEASRCLRPPNFNKLKYVCVNSCINWVPNISEEIKSNFFYQRKTRKKKKFFFFIRCDNNYLFFSILECITNYSFIYKCWKITLSVSFSQKKKKNSKEKKNHQPRILRWLLKSDFFFFN